ncbi:MAG: sortase B protein-sorting domain-containing protein, partial [Christensenellaceae bacterium]
IFADQVYSDLLSGTATPAFEGTPTREGYVFKGWTPAVAETVTDDATYTAVWEKSSSSNKSGGTTNSSNTSKSSGSGTSKSNTSVSSPKTGDESNITLWIVLFAFSGIALAGVLVYKRRKTN